MYSSVSEMKDAANNLINSHYDHIRNECLEYVNKLKDNLSIHNFITNDELR